MVHSSLSSFAVVSLSVAASLLETFPYHPFNGPFLYQKSLSLAATSLERGSESFRGFSISSFQRSIPLSSFAIVSLSVAARERNLLGGSSSPSSSFQWSIPLSGRRRRKIIFYAVVSTSVAASLLETFPYHPFNGPFLSESLSPSSPWAWQRVF